MLRPLRLPGGDYRFRREDLEEMARGGPSPLPMSIRIYRSAKIEPTADSYVYFIQCGAVGPIKIGYARDVE
jgi:hypothetical protein